LDVWNSIPIIKSLPLQKADAPKLSTVATGMAVRRGVAKRAFDPTGNWE